ncbi:MAG: hypothetical protein KGS47_02345 [Chloroflexi bacterium]|nr:hypothetical protein [Chloroflexota bacterium]
MNRWRTDALPFEALAARLPRIPTVGRTILPRSCWPAALQPAWNAAAGSYAEGV